MRGSLGPIRNPDGSVTISAEDAEAVRQLVRSALTLYLTVGGRIAPTDGDSVSLDVLREALDRLGNSHYATCNVCGRLVDEATTETDECHDLSWRWSRRTIVKPCLHTEGCVVREIPWSAPLIRLANLVGGRR